MPVIKFRRGTAAQWGAGNPILSDGEPGYEIDTKRVKIGDGVQRWTELPYILPAPEIQDLIDEAEAEITPVEETQISGLVEEILDLPSLVLLWENAKT